MQDLIEVIKQLKNSTQETVAERTKAEALFSSIGEGAIVTDEKGMISRVNKTALDMLGFSKKDLIGKWFPKVIVATTHDDKIIDPMNRGITRAFINGRTVSEKARYLTKEGKQLPVYYSVSPILLDNKPIGAIEVFRDITLEEEIDKMKSEFISIASHQLRTPLSAINTYASMLASGFQGELNAGQKEYMAIILSAIERMNELITTLLDISQMEAGKINVSLQVINLTTLIDNIVGEVKQSAEAKKIRLDISVPAQKLIINSDPLLLREVYTNLISNAIKYTPPGGNVVVSFDITKTELILKVKDTGLGIPKDLQSLVFTKFFRADNARKKETTGTGLGLYMAKQIANVLNGRLWFKSRENFGSTFYFALPLSNEEVDDGKLG